MSYDRGRFVRKGAPAPAKATLPEGAGCVLQLEGSAHGDRKQMFLRILEADSTARLAWIMAAQWRLCAERRSRQEQVVLRGKVQQILCRTACRWAAA